MIAHIQLNMALKLPNADDVTSITDPGVPLSAHTAPAAFNAPLPPPYISFTFAICTCFLLL